jgi:hypothetical protein
MIKLLLFDLQDPESALSFLKRCNRFIKRIELLNYFVVAELQERIPVPSMCLKTKKGSLVSKIELD